ncbi:ABC transporter ATP-binding protein [Gemella sp. GH3]|uniref:ABC transporter ATP-binding protein n=1 Tax=unclassified Gemella TaxID=2624949 RepID=UPI0015D07E18|nr:MULTISPECIES: ABC transporter ATP-binding protein [unclassified Gemella]MBF0713871.1 ABC transporter ATP-binding protein [Gemella sp. GH3.1]NYS50823.1 ABC transporter ATP-binding protein [Gemella sp. GH3]
MSNKSSFRLLKYLSRYKFSIVIAIVATLVAVICSAFMPKYYGRATTIIINDFVSTGRIELSSLYPIIKVLITLYTVSMVFTYVMQYLAVKLTKDVVYSLRKDLRKKFEKLPISYYDQNETGQIMSKITNDITVIGNNLGQIITQFLQSLFAIISIVVVMFTVSVDLSFVILASIPITIFVSLKRAKKSQPLYRKKQNALGGVNSYVEEYFTGYEVINTFDRKEETLKDFKKLNDKLCNEAIKAEKISASIFPTSLFINNITYVLITIIGFAQVLNGRLEVGYVQSMIQYVKQLGQPIGNLANISSLLQSTIAASDRVFEVLDNPEEDNSETLELQEVKGKLDIENLFFGYDKTKNILKNISFNIKPGETVAIVGPTGSGKTTFINLLMRFYDATSGKIKLDGTDITKYKKETVRRKMGMVLQETWLFNGTIMDNLKYGNDSATEEDVYKAATRAGADTFIRQTAQGYNTILNEKMDNISAGQKQLLTIARALVGNPDIYILDEATSNIDSKTEKTIQKAMDKIMSEKTTIVIAHRLSTIENADKIVVIKDGELLEQGNHKELLSQKGFYYDLYTAQYNG